MLGVDFGRFERYARLVNSTYMCCQPCNELLILILTFIHLVTTVGGGPEI